MDRVRTAKTDLEYYETASKFVASFRDGHTGYSTPSLFLADLGVYVDIYDGKVLIEQIVRSRLPIADYPFEIGDELVSLDGKPVELLIEELASQQSYSNPRTTRRAASATLAALSTEDGSPTQSAAKATGWPNSSPSLLATGARLRRGSRPSFGRPK